jgi:hypothetical protein
LDYQILKDSNELKILVKNVKENKNYWVSFDQECNERFAYWRYAFADYEKADYPIYFHSLANSKDLKPNDLIYFYISKKSCLITKVEQEDAAISEEKYIPGVVSALYPEQSKIKAGLYNESEKYQQVLLTMEAGCVDFKKWQSDIAEKILVTYGQSRELTPANYLGQTVYFNAQLGGDLANPCKIVDFKLVNE